MAASHPPDQQSPNMSSSETIQLKIKVPPGHLSSADSSTFDLGSLPVTTKVGSLRQQIQTLVPAHPAPERQRLLYGGRALVDNEQTLQDALNTRRDPQQREFVVHLLVRGEGMQNSSSIIPPRRAEHRRTGSAPPPIERQAQSQQGQQRTAAESAQQQAQAQAQVQIDPMQIHQQMHQQAVQQGMQFPFAQFQHPQMQQMGQAPRPGGMPMPQFAGVGPQGQPMAIGGLQMMPNGMPMQFPINMPMPPQRPPSIPRPTLHQPDVTGDAVPQQPQESAQSNGDSQTNGRASAPPTQAQQQQHLPQDQSQQPQAQQQPHEHQRNTPWQGTYHVEARGPNGERIQLQHQTFNYTGQVPGQVVPPFRQPPFGPNFGAMQPQMIPQGMPMIPGMPPAMAPMAMHPQQHMPSPYHASHPPPPSGHYQNGAPREPSALDRARQNMVEMRRMLDEMRNQSTAMSEEERSRRLGEVEYRARQVEGYIDPFHLGAQNNATPGTATAGVGAVPGAGASPNANVPGERSSVTPTTSQPTPRRLYNPSRSSNERELRQQTPSDPNQVTAYLLSSPEGPQAMLFSPQFGTYTGAFPPNAQAAPTRTIQPGAMQRYAGQPFPYTQQAPTAAAGAPPAGQQAVVQQDPVARAAAAHLANGAMAQQAANAQAVAAGRDPGIQDPLAPIQPLLAHFWLLLRILIFAYFLLGSNLGYTRPMLLMGIGLVFWGIRMGALGEHGAAVRRWWDGVVGVPERRREGEQAGQQGQGQANQGQGQDQGQPNNNAAGAPPAQAGQPAAGAGGRQQQRMPTPEQVAQRLLNEDAARRAERRGWLRERVRPVERAVALFVASLWPGIGEAHVRAREQEQRRLQEEEVAARRRAEEERAKKEAEESGEKKEGGAAVESDDSKEAEKVESSEKAAAATEKSATET